MRRCQVLAAPGGNRQISMRGAQELGDECTPRPGSWRRSREVSVNQRQEYIPEGKYPKKLKIVARRLQVGAKSYGVVRLHLRCRPMSSFARSRISHQQSGIC